MAADVVKGVEPVAADVARRVVLAVARAVPVAAQVAVCAR